MVQVHMNLMVGVKWLRVFKDSRDGGVTDGLHLRGEVSKDDACLRFLLDNSNSHRREVGIRDSYEFVLPEVKDSTFRLGACVKSLTLTFYIYSCMGQATTSQCV